MTLREPAGRRELSFFPPPESAPLPGKPEFRIDASGSTKMQKAVRRNGLLYFPGGSLVSQAPPSSCVRFGGMDRPFAGRDARRGIRFGLGSDVPDTGCCFAQAHNARTVSVM